MLRFFHLLFPVLAALALLPSCQTLHFYGQAISGQLEISRKSRPNDEVRADPASRPALRSQLAAVEEIRRFASDHLSLPGDTSYGKYADLGRQHVVWVLYAAPEFSLKARTWHSTNSPIARSSTGATRSSMNRSPTSSPRRASSAGCVMRAATWI